MATVAATPVIDKENARSTVASARKTSSRSALTPRRPFGEVQNTTAAPTATPVFSARKKGRSRPPTGKPPASSGGNAGGADGGGDGGIDWTFIMKGADPARSELITQLKHNADSLPIWFSMLEYEEDNPRLSNPATQRRFLLHVYERATRMLSLEPHRKEEQFARIWIRLAQLHEENGDPKSARRSFQYIKNEGIGTNYSWVYAAWTAFELRPSNHINGTEEMAAAAARAVAERGLERHPSATDLEALLASMPNKPAEKPQIRLGFDSDGDSPQLRFRSRRDSQNTDNLSINLRRGRYTRKGSEDLTASALAALSEVTAQAPASAGAADPETGGTPALRRSTSGSALTASTAAPTAAAATGDRRTKSSLTRGKRRMRSLGLRKNRGGALRVQRKDQKDPETAGGDRDNDGDDGDDEADDKADANDVNTGEDRRSSTSSGRSSRTSLGGASAASTTSTASAAQTGSGGEGGSDTGGSGAVLAMTTPAPPERPLERSMAGSQMGDDTGLAHTRLADLGATGTATVAANVATKVSLPVAADETATTTVEAPPRSQKRKPLAIVEPGESLEPSQPVNPPPQAAPPAVEVAATASTAAPAPKAAGPATAAKRVTFGSGTANPAQQQQQQQQHQQQQVQQQVPPIVVNNIPYARLEVIGKGGSSKVFKVQSPDGRTLALKRVRIRGEPRETVEGYINEITLLRRLQGVDRVVRLVDAEVNRDVGVIYVVMECGDGDLSRILKRASKAGLTPGQIRAFWSEMLKCVQVIHGEKIVHSDLKPANFVLVGNALKLIDFGIASAIKNDTTNIVRENQIGTLNYMSPEAILDTSPTEAAGQRIKLGRPSDVWSLGCILYQMVYGRCPFSKLNVIQKLQAIINPAVEIDYPPLDFEGSEEAIEVMRACLVHDPKDRLTISELLAHPFLNPPPPPSRENDEAVASGSGGVSIARSDMLEIVFAIVAKTKAQVAPEDMQRWSAAIYKQVATGQRPDLRGLD